MDVKHGINQMAVVEDGVLLGKMVVVGPRAVVLAGKDGEAVTVLGDSCQIGANATLYPGVNVGTRAVVRPGAVVTISVPPLAIVEGNPAKIIGYVKTIENSLPKIERFESGGGGIVASSVDGVTLHSLNTVLDMRGNLSVGEFEKDIPFQAKRFFLVYDVPTQETRGEHAHYACHQFLIAVKGSVSVIADDGRNREEFVLNRHSIGLHLPPMTWGIQYRYSADGVLLVFASDYYDHKDYIRDYNEFLQLKKTAHSVGNLQTGAPDSANS